MNEEKHEDAGKLFLSIYLGSILWEDCHFDTKCNSNDDAPTGISSMIPNVAPPVAINLGLKVGGFLLCTEPASGQCTIEMDYSVQIPIA